MKRLFLSLLCFLVGSFSPDGFSQDYTLFHIDNESGLPSNLTKSIEADSRGLIWIATDGGLIRFNGRDFDNFQFQFNTRYIKDLVRDTKGGMFVASDEGAGYITPNQFNPKFTMLVQSSTLFSENELHYPKELFVDGRGTLWISDINGVAKWENGSFKKYNFNFKYHSNSFFKSFGFGEINGSLYITSWQGYIFYYDQRTDSLISVPLPKSNQGKIIHTFYCKGDSLFLGQSDGLYLLKMNSAHQITANRKLSSVSSVSSVFAAPSGSIWFGTYNDGLFRIDEAGVTDFSKVFAELNGISVKDFYIDGENNVWICTDNGVFILQEKFFKNVTISGPQTQKRGGVKQIFSNSSGQVFYYDNESIFLIGKEGRKYHAEKIFSKPGVSILYSAAANADELWISTTGQQLLKYSIQSGEKTLVQQLNDDHFYSLFTDSKGRLWSYLARNRTVAVIDKNEFKSYPITFPDVVYINEFAETEKGDILIACNGRNNFLLRFDEKTESLTSVTAGFFHDYKSVQTLDIHVDKERILLATDRGLLEAVNNLSAVKRIDTPGEYLPSSVYNTSSKGLWVGTEQGIHVFFKDDSLRFDRFSGLQSSSVVRGGILELPGGDIFTANVNGIAVLSGQRMVLRKSVVPVLIGISYQKEDDEFAAAQDPEFLIGSSVGFSFSSPVYPPDKVRYRVKISGSQDDGWIYTKFQGVYYLPNLPTGNYTLLISAKESGRLWSEPLVYSFSIVLPWYSSPLTIIAGSFLLLGVIVFGINLFVSYRFKRLEENRITLEEKVEERTKALLEAKREVEKLLNDAIKSKSEVEFVNEQIKKLLGIAAHDLKNPLQSILGLSHLIQGEEDINPAKEYSQVISDAANKMLRQINELLETAVFDISSAELTKETFDLREVIVEVTEANRTRAEQKHQEIIISVKDELPVNSSRDWLRRVLDNLVNNAVKYSQHNKHIHVKSWKDNHTVYLTVSDEGPGFTAADIKNLFVRFKRLSARPTGGESSTGLGLALVKEMLNALGGDISLTQSSTGGAEFTIRLNLHKESV
ncbi:MAG: sensor histidine kinase [Ignavibacteriales bacterium]